MSFDQIAEQYRRTIRAQVSRILTDDADREDCIQDIMLRLYQAHASSELPTGPTLTSYVVATARNTALNLRAANARRNAVICTSIDAPRPDGSEPTYDDSAMFGDNGGPVITPLMRDVTEALHTLPADSAEVLRMRFYDDLTTSEIAAELGLTEIAVRKRLSRATIALKNVLASGHTKAA